MKNLARIFFASFFACLVTVMTVFGLLYVAETSKSQSGGSAALSIEMRSPHTLSLSFMGKTAELEVGIYDRIAALLGEHGILILPRGARLALQWGEAAKRALTGESPSPTEPEYKNAWLV